MNEKYDIKLFEVVVHELGHLLIDLFIKKIEPTFIDILHVDFNYKINEYVWSGMVKIKGKYEGSEEHYKLVVSDDEYLLLNFISICSGCIIQELISNIVGNNIKYTDCLIFKKGALGRMDAYLIESLKSEHRIVFNYNGVKNKNLFLFFEELPRRVYEFITENIKLINNEFIQISEKLYIHISENFAKNPNPGFSFTVDGLLLKSYSEELFNISNETTFFDNLHLFYLAILEEYRNLMSTV